jgi:hypothetical protein
MNDIQSTIAVMSRKYCLGNEVQLKLRDLLQKSTLDLYDVETIAAIYAAMKINQRSRKPSNLIPLRDLGKRLRSRSSDTKALQKLASRRLKRLQTAQVKAGIYLITWTRDPNGSEAYTFTVNF